MIPTETSVLLFSLPTKGKQSVAEMLYFYKCE